MLDCCASQKKHTDRRYFFYSSENNRKLSALYSFVLPKRQTNGRLSENEHVNDREKAKSSMLFQYLMDSSVHGMRYLCEPRRHWSERFDILLYI